MSKAVLTLSILCCVPITPKFSSVKKVSSVHSDQRKLRSASTGHGALRGSPSIRRHRLTLHLTPTQRNIAMALI